MKKIIPVIVVFLVLLPIVYIVFEGVRAVSGFANKNVSNIKVNSFGEPTPIDKRDFTPTTLIKGTIIAMDKKTQTIIGCEQAVMVANVGAEISKNDKLALCSGKERKADFSGVISDIVFNGPSVTVVYDDYSSKYLETKVKASKIKSFQQDFRNDEVTLQYIKNAQTIDEEGNLTVYYLMLSETDSYINDIKEYYFFNQKSVGIQNSVNKSAVFFQKSKSYIRALNPDGTIIGDVEVNILYEDIGSYAISFSDGFSCDYYDLEYGIFKNSMDGSKNVE